MAYKFSKGNRGLGDITFEDDTDTGIDFGQDSVSLHTNGQPRLEVGNEGVLVTGDLEVTNEISGSMLKNSNGDVTIKADGGSGDVYIQANDRVYIELDKDNNSTSYFQVRSGNNTKFLIDEDGKVRIGDATPPSNTLQIVHNGADGNDGILLTRNDVSTTSGDLLGVIGFDSRDGNTPSSNLEASAFIAGYAAENHGTSDKGGYLVFGTSKINDNDDTISTEHMRIESEGVIQASGMPGYILAYRSWSNTADENVVITSGTVQYIEGGTNGKANITFVAPPTGNVELELHVYIEQASPGANLLMALSTDGSSWATQAASYHRVFDGDETDDGVITVKWVLTGLTAGSSYTYYFGALTTSSNGITLRWGDGGLSSTQYSPLIMKATTLPSSIS